MLPQAAPLGGVVRRLQALELGGARPLAVYRQQTPAGEPQRVLDDRPPKAAFISSRSGGSCASARARTFSPAAPRLPEPATTSSRRRRLSVARSSCEPRACSRAFTSASARCACASLPCKVLGGPREADERVLAAPLRLQAQLVLAPGHVVERLLQPIDGGGVGGRFRRPPRPGQRVADQHGEDQSGESEDGGERIHCRPACHAGPPPGVRPPAAIPPVLL